MQCLVGRGSRLFAWRLSSLEPVATSRRFGFGFDLCYYDRDAGRPWKAPARQAFKRPPTAVSLVGWEAPARPGVSGKPLGPSWEAPGAALVRLALNAAMPSVLLLPGLPVPTFAGKGAERPQGGFSLRTGADDFKARPARHTAQPAAACGTGALSPAGGLWAPELRRVRPVRRPRAHSV